MTESNQCSICLEPFTTTNNTVTQCGHQFHSSCLFTQIKHPTHPSINCPLCRHPLFTPPVIDIQPMAYPTGETIGEVDGREDYLNDPNDPFILNLLNLCTSPRDIQQQLLRRVHPDNYENIISDNDINNIINSANMYSLQNQVDYQLITSRIRELFINILTRQLNNVPSPWQDNISIQNMQQMHTEFNVDNNVNIALPI